MRAGSLVVAPGRNRRGLDRFAWRVKGNRPIGAACLLTV